MSDEKKKTENLKGGFRAFTQDGYRPLNEGYQPEHVKQGYQPQASLSQASPEKLPVGGTNVIPPKENTD